MLQGLVILMLVRSIAAGTYDVGFLPLNGPRHVRTLTPCLQAVHEEIFGENLTALVGCNSATDLPFFFLPRSLLGSLQDPAPPLHSALGRALLLRPVCGVPGDGPPAQPGPVMSKIADMAR